MPTPGSSSPSHRSEPRCHLLLHPTQLILPAPVSPADASIIPGHPSPPLPHFQCPRYSSNLHPHGPCCGRWGRVWGHLDGDTPPLRGLCALPPSHFPTGRWLVASICRGAGRIRPVVPREQPRYRLTSTPERYEMVEEVAWNPWELLGPILGVPPWIFHPGAIWELFSRRDRTHLGGFPVAFGHLIPTP